MNHEFNDNPIENAAQEWFVLLQTGQPSAEDRRKFELWRKQDARHQAAYDELKAVWSGVEPLRDAFAQQATDTQPEAIFAESEQSSPPPVPSLPGQSTWSTRFRWCSLGAAIVLAAVLFGPSLAIQLTADHRTGVGEQAQVELPDGSKAWLNTDTAISINFSEDHRRISLLRGEAQFDVTSDPQRPFSVAADYGTATAVGTVFVVRDSDSTSTVTVVEGQVAVKAREKQYPSFGEKIPTLTQGQQVQVLAEHRLSSIETVNLSSVHAWREGFISIGDLPVDEALAEIDRYRPGKIVLMTDSRDLDSITARIAIDTVDDGLKSIAASSGLSVIHVTDYLVILR